jgi:hypothetical protein
MNVMRIVVTTEQRSALGRVLPVDYFFNVRREHEEQCPTCLKLGIQGGAGWFIETVKVVVELDANDSIDDSIDTHLIECVVLKAELMEQTS